ncbi:MAG: prepilin-type N-terminal cleavage/methylation domain-containing protein [Fimbriimonadaceae bacterium]|nr:prepilin-type N-terminal cleavage/methylation domain-containing protein [Fimbriimonadaceae bacterium]
MPIVRKLVSTVAFTVIELLVVVAIISVIAGITYPVLVETKRESKRVTCFSNLMQIGRATLIYCGDHNDRFPVAFDSAQRHVYLWSLMGDQRNRIQDIAREAPITTELLAGYVRSRSVWRCPMDSGTATSLYMPINSPEDEPQIDIALRPTAWDAQGTSYAYRLQLGVFGSTGSSPCRLPSSEDLGSAGSAMFVDVDGMWHGRVPETRTNTVFVDGHARTLSRNEFLPSWLCDPR